MNKARRTFSTAAVVTLTVLLGAGAASASGHEPHHQPARTRPAAAAPPPTTWLHGQGNSVHQPDHPDSPAAFPHHDHREERLNDDEQQMINAAPHTWWRFHAGSL